MTQQISPREMVDAIDSQWFIEDVESRLDTGPFHLNECFSTCAIGRGGKRRP